MLIGIVTDTDGASANFATAGLKGLVENKVPWLYRNWCLAHHMELAVKDALKGTLFDITDGTVAVNKKLTLCFHFYDRGTVVRRAVKR